jgi:hypothetical protein
MASLKRLLALTAAIVAIGCDDDSSKPAGHAGDTEVDAGHEVADAAADAALADDAAIVVGAGAMPDAGAMIVNDSFETAAPLEVDVKPPLHDITRPGQMDFYWFEGEAGAYYALYTDFNAFSPDTVITLFDADHEQLAENDDGAMWGGDVYDSRLVVRLHKSGKHFVRISTHLGLAPIQPPVYYHLGIKQLLPDADGVTVQTTEASAKVRFAHDDASGYDYATVLGDFAEVKAAAFELHGQSDDLLIVHVLQSGVDGDGSTARVGSVRVAGADGSLIGEIDGAQDQEFLHPPLSDAEYRLDAELDGKAGDHGFFAIDLVMLPDNPREKAEEENGALEGAEPIDLKASMFSRRGLLLSRLPEKDVDYFRFEATGPTAVTVACEGQSGGSGVLGLHAELRDADDQMLAAADESAAENLLIDSFVLDDVGTYYLRLSSKTPADEDAAEPWARCALIARP